MAQRDGEIENLAHAYRVLDARWDASPRAIKASYRKLVKRWHPDRHTPGTPGHTEATLMTRLLNEAYTRVENAPLRNGFADPAAAYSPQRSGSAGDCRDQAKDQAKDEPEPSGASRSEYVPRDPVEDATDFYRAMENARKAGARDDAARPFDWVGFAVRFVIGALFGVLVSFRVTIAIYQHPKAVPVAVAVTILVCGLASGFGGDAFWRAIRPGGIWSWRRWD
jgi:DnaJ domain